jgi:O-acetyl-ADP-ribose deacetylase (regulator of RNase III)
MCPLYIQDKKFCYVKLTSNEFIASSLLQKSLPMLKENWSNECHGDLELCSFKEKVVQEVVAQEVQEAEKPQEKQPITGTKVSIHKHANPYAVKSDFIYYPTNSILTIDDQLLNNLSKHKVQEECDRLKKPYKMGNIYITSNGGENSLVKAKNIIHGVVAGESRLVNEEDIRSSTRKALLHAEQNGASSIVMIPADCGTHDIFDTARVQLAAVKTFLKSFDANIKNVYFVMEDEESYKAFQEYYNRIFLS